LTNKTPFSIYSLAVEGLSVVTKAVTPFTAEATVLQRGDVLEITSEIFELNTDRTGFCWLDLTTAEQVERWGRARFALGTETPEHILEERDAAHRATLEAERGILLRNNPHLAKRTAAAARIFEIDRELAG